jgi:drug/metabolite transporter (DMT)-like permease
VRLRSGAVDFNPAVWLAVLAVIGVAARDLATRATSAAISTLQLAFWGYALSIPSGIILYFVLGQTFVRPTAGQWLYLAGAQVLGITFYYVLTLVLRIGEASAVVPFRYSRLVFALALGVGVLGERPDIWMLAGSALVIASGLYTLTREARLRRQASPMAGQPI